jgi:branched-subunit amino acid transport protein AzlD
MILSAYQAFILILMMMIGTVMTRFLPFVCFPDNKEISPYITYLSKVLPYAVVGLLVVYCLKDVEIAAQPFGITEVLGVLATIVLHKFFNRTLVSIAGGTLFYMMLLRMIG